MIGEDHSPEAIVSVAVFEEAVAAITYRGSVPAGMVVAHPLPGVPDKVLVANVKVVVAVGPEGTVAERRYR
jgi:hypothetical protein